MEQSIQYSEVLDFNVANYQFNNNNEMSFYVKLKNEEEKEFFIWDKGLEEVIKDNNIQKGEHCNFEVEKTEEVKVKVKEELEDGTIDFNEISVQKKIWKVDIKERQNEICQNIDEFDENIKRADKIKNTINDLSDEEKKILNILNEKEKVQQDIKNHIDLMNEYETPAEKRKFTQNVLNNLNDNADIKTAIDILNEKEKVQKEIKQTKEQIELENNQNSDKSNKIEDKIDKKSDEEYEKLKNELEKDHKERLKKLEDKLQRLEHQFENAVENLVNSNSISQILKSLYDMDKTLSLIFKEKDNSYDELNKQREEKLKLALESQTTKEVVKEFVKELHSKNKDLNSHLNTMENDKKIYLELSELTKKDKKLDIKDIEKINKYIDKIDKEAPTFKENYPKKYKEIKSILENSKKNIFDNSKTRGL